MFKFNWEPPDHHTSAASIAQKVNITHKKPFETTKKLDVIGVNEGKL